MKNFEAFNLLGLLFALVLISSTVTADEKSKEENKGVVDGKTKETNPVPGDAEKQGYGGGGGYCGRCCWRHGYHYCGSQCCWPQKEETEAASEAAADANPDGYGWGGRGGGGWGGGRGGGGWGGGRGGGGWGGGRGGGGWGGGASEAAYEANPDGYGWGGGRGWGGRGAGGWGGGRGGGGWGGGGV